MEDLSKQSTSWESGSKMADKFNTPTENPFKLDLKQCMQYLKITCFSYIIAHFIVMWNRMLFQSRGCETSLGSSESTGQGQNSC